MVLHAVRAAFLLVVLATTISFASQESVTTRGTTYVTGFILVPALAAFALVVLDMLWRRKRLQELSGLFFGLLAGLVIAWVVTEVMGLVMGAFQILGEDRAVVPLVKLLCGTAAVFLCVTFVLQTKDVFRFVIPYVEFSKQSKGPRVLLLDTSAIIDGRIADIAETRVLESEMIVPRFILDELQTIADSDDKLRRNRGRRGLDILHRLQKSPTIDIRIMDARVEGMEASLQADARLVALSQHLNARVVTNDYNLNKVAQLRGVNVININDLANALKPIVLPGETLAVKITKPGEESGQGVGYLDDGTMVVVEQARDYIGQEIVISVTSVLQTSAGRMIFGRIEPNGTFSRGRSEGKAGGPPRAQQNDEK